MVNEGGVGDYSFHSLPRQMKSGVRQRLNNIVFRFYGNVLFWTLFTRGVKSSEFSIKVHSNCAFG